MPFGADVELVGKLSCVVVDPGQKQGLNLSLLSLALGHCLGQAGVGAQAPNQEQICM